jgi:hypothetical protein
MKIKVGDKIYDGNEEPIMVILEDYDKENILNMAPEAIKYCHFPEDMSEDDARNFMKIEEK